MKSVKADLLNEVVSVYDQNKTTIQGRVTQKVINGNTVLGPPVNDFVDVFQDTGAIVTPVLTYLTDSGRLFTISGEGAGLISVTLHTVNLNTGAKAYIGFLRINIADNAATTHVLRGLKVLDTGTSGWKIYVATSASVLINGGVYCANSIDFSDFTAIGSVTIPFATGSNQKAVYFLQDPANIGVGQLNIAAAGLVVDKINSRLYCHNGVAATHQYYVYNTAVVLDCPLTIGASVDAGTDVVTDTGHSYAVNTPVFITGLSGGTGLTNNAIYYVRNPVAGVSYQLSLTTGGAVVNVTTNGTFNVCRAFGTTGSAFVHKTGNLPALTGTLILSDSEDYAIPQHTTNAGEPCVFFSTTSRLYLGRLSELTSGAVTWSSLVFSNIDATLNSIIAPTLVLSSWSNVLDRAVYLTNNNILIMKQVVNNTADKIFAGTNNKRREAVVLNNVVELGFLTATAIDIEDGWLAINTSTPGQTGVIISDLRSEALFDYSYIVTKVLNTPDAIYKFMTTIDELYSVTGSLKVQYRTSGFGSITGGWVDIPFAEDITSFASGNQVQFKISFMTLELDTCIPAQIAEFFLGYESLFEVSDNWEVSRDNSSGLTPTRVAFRLKNAYGSVVPTLFFRAYNLTSALLITNDTITNSGNFEYSTDNGISWQPLGVIPNVVGTLIRYTFTTPPGIDIRPSLKHE